MPSDDLFRLIKSLTTQEKKHFRQFASRARKNAKKKTKYEQLYDAINRQKGI